MTKQKLIDDLLMEWKLESGAGNEFTSDGIIDEPRWNAASKKILFVLKEPGEDPTRFIDQRSDSLLDLYRQWGGARYSFNYLGRLAYGLMNASETGYPGHETASIPNNQNEAFLSSAFMNIKKIPSLRSDRSCDSKILFKYSVRWKKYILQQLELISADIIVFCGADMPDIANRGLQLPVKSSTYFLFTCHPSARTSKADKYEIILRKYRLDSAKPNDVLRE